MKKFILALILCACSHSVFSQIELPEFRYTPITPSNSNQGYRSSSPSLEPYSNPLLKQQIPLPELSYSRTNTVLDNGWYEADVVYYNPRTKTKSSYTLDVKSHNDRIIAIRFGDGESVHTGANHNNYTYSGGDLTFYENSKGQIVSADTTVKIFRNGSYTYYTIEIE